MAQSSTTFDTHFPELLIANEPIPIKYLQYAGATSGQVIKYNGTTVVWADEAVSPGEISLASAHLLVGNASNVAADVAMSGDATMANTGALTIANSAVTTAKINAAAVTGAKLSTTVGYFAVTVSTNGTSPVDVFGATVPFAGTVTGVFVESLDTTAGNITVADTAGTIATIAKGTSTGAMVGGGTLANTSFSAGNTFTVVSSSAGNARVTITFTVA